MSALEAPQSSCLRQAPSPLHSCPPAQPMPHFSAIATGLTGLLMSAQCSSRLSSSWRSSPESNRRGRLSLHPGTKSRHDSGGSLSSCSRVRQETKRKCKAQAALGTKRPQPSLFHCWHRPLCNLRRCAAAAASTLCSRLRFRQLSLPLQLALCQWQWHIAGPAAGCAPGKPLAQRAVVGLDAGCVQLVEHFQL